MDDPLGNPLAFAPVEIVLALSTVAGLAVAAYVLLGASRSRFEWRPALVIALVALIVPVAGPVVAFLASRNLDRTRQGAAQRTS